MKRKFEHPEPPFAGKRYWRSLDDLADKPEFKEWLEKEFPAGAAELELDGVTRRGFLRLMGASVALAGLGLAGCRRPETYLVPYTKSAEWLVPGKAMQYATAFPRPSGAVPLLATAYEGRPTRVDGHDLAPGSSMGSDARIQASILGLYDPDRARSFRDGQTTVTPEKFSELIQKLEADYTALQGEGLAFLSEASTSPTRARLVADLLKKYPRATYAVYEPVSDDNWSKASQIAFGGRFQLLPRWDKADVILSVEADFTSTEEWGSQAVRGYASRRRVRSTDSTLNRLYVVESRFTPTGGTADHRLRLPASRQAAFLSLVAGELGVGGVAPATEPAFDEITKKWAVELAADLKGYGKALVVVGQHQPVEVQLLGIAINQALGAFRSTLDLIPALTPPYSTLLELADKMRAGAVKTLFIVGGNPVYNAPVDVDWAGLQAKVSQVIRLGLYEDETSQLSHWQAPMAHYLESWGDGRAYDGTYLTLQPLILPLFDGITEEDLLAALLGNRAGLIPVPALSPEKLATPTVPGQDSAPMPFGCMQVQATFALISKTSGEALDSAWKKTLHDGFLAGSAYAPVIPGVAGGATAYIQENLKPVVAGEEIELVLYPCPQVGDGRYANNGWLQELPDSVTKLTWDNAVLVSPKTAMRLGLKMVNYPSLVPYFPSIVPPPKDTTNELDQAQADVLKITVNGQTLEAAAFVSPGQADDSLALALGYGRTRAGQVGNGVGFNAYKLRGSAAPWVMTGIKVERAGRGYTLAQTQEHHSMEGRALVREATLLEYKADPKFVGKMSIDSHQPPLESFYTQNRAIYPAPKLDGQHQWGMVIDLSTCTGCNACITACQSENNTPIVGKDQVVRGREMHWMRLDRYYSDSPEDPQMAVQPLLCMHCENAPCETVCPVNATVHTEEGLNVMAYNRCIGTRYCANNCPYKVRRFNFFDYNKRKIGKTKIGPIELGNLYLGPLGAKNDDEMVQMQKNPNVTVRMRGVMEKCTFCVQRIEDAKITAIVRAGTGPDKKVKADSFKVACQVACAAEAIVFGDISNPESEVSKLRGSELEYGLMTHLATKPRVTYLARVRNPNPKMPGAEKIGLGSDWDAHGHKPGGHHGAPEHGAPEHGAVEHHEEAPALNGAEHSEKKEGAHSAH